MTQIADQPAPKIRSDLFQREQVGIDRYGTAPQAHNGRDSIIDAYQEALDLACYLRQTIEEGGLVARHGADDTPRDPAVHDTPGQLLALILDGSAERRIEICEKFQAAARTGNECFHFDHVGRIELLEHRVRELSCALVRAMSGLPVAPDSDVANLARWEARGDGG